MRRLLLDEPVRHGAGKPPRIRRFRLGERQFTPAPAVARVRVLLLGTGVQPIPPHGYGGVERTIAEFGAALEAAGHEVEILNEVRHRRGVDEYWFALHLNRLLADQHYDVLHASTPAVANRLAMLGRPFVYTSHSRHWFERVGLRQRFGYWLERRAVPRAAATIALTSRLATAIRSETRARGPRRLEIIPIGVDTDRFRPAVERRTGRTALGVGVVLPFKRWELAARALRGTGMGLTIVGPTPDPSYARVVQTAGDSVRLLGEVDDPELTRLYAESDLLIHPSRVELMAGVVLQGMAAALPILGADPVAELIEEGVSGFCTGAAASDDDIVSGLSAAARRLVADPALARRMGEAGRRRALERFSWPTVVAAHLALYRSLTASGSISPR